jgi:two-component system response regulator CpxR
VTDRRDASVPGPILVVDDDQDNRDAIRDVLEDEGYEVIEAVDGEKALEYLVARQNVAPALVLLNISMPHMTGWELVAVMRRYRHLAVIPVVLLSGMDPQRQPDRMGMVAAYLRKPYDSTKLLEVVAKHALSSGRSHPRVDVASS